MIKYYCNTCGEQVRTLSDLTDLRSANSAKPHDGRLAFDGNFQEQVCQRCIHAIKHFITTLAVKKAPPNEADQVVSTRVQ